MKNTVKILEGLAIGMIVGGTAGAFLVSRMRSGGDAKKRFTHAVKSACGFIEDICG
ncbi:MAG: hypothetical protein IKL05_03085 [Clostridia bacterium]|nr:hypothetical protein [Clostridia bacterium]